MTATPRIELRPDTHLLVLTGAGVSAESGVPTFRGSNGLWENQRVEEVASPLGFNRDPALVWRFYSQRRGGAKDVKPNPGHEALARIEAQLGDRFLLATQNVDGLHRKAGSQRVVELHGNLFTSRCTRCDRPPFHDERLAPEGESLECEECAKEGRKAYLRPHIVWFGELLDSNDMARIEDFVGRASLGHFVFLAVGTSGAVYPAAGLVTVAKRVGAETWLVNADPAENGALFDHFVVGKSGELLPELLGTRVQTEG